MKLLEVEGARAPVPHSWLRHCVRMEKVRDELAVQCAVGRCCVVCGPQDEFSLMFIMLFRYHYVHKSEY